MRKDGILLYLLAPVQLWLLRIIFVGDGLLPTTRIHHHRQRYPALPLLVRTHERMGELCDVTTLSKQPVMLLEGRVKHRLVIQP